MTLEKRKYKSPSPMTPTDSRRLETRVSTSAARPVLGLPSATSPGKKSHRKGRGESLEREKTVIELGIN